MASQLLLRWASNLPFDRYARPAFLEHAQHQPSAVPGQRCFLHGELSVPRGPSQNSRHTVSKKCIFPRSHVSVQANLQDYSYHISQMVSLTPSQFCRAAAHHQRGKRLQLLDPLIRAKPGLYEVDDSFAISRFSGTSKVVCQRVTPQPIKVRS